MAFLGVTSLSVKNELWEAATMLTVFTTVSLGSAAVAYGVKSLALSLLKMKVPTPSEEQVKWSKFGCFALVVGAASAASMYILGSRFSPVANTSTFESRYIQVLLYTFGSCGAYMGVIDS